MAPINRQRSEHYVQSSLSFASRTMPKVTVHANIWSTPRHVTNWIKLISVVVALAMTMTHISFLLSQRSHHSRYTPSKIVDLDGQGFTYPSMAHNNTKGEEIYRTTNDHSLLLSLRFDWTNLAPTLEWTKRILRHQSDCTLPVGPFTFRNRFGLGSDLHVYAQALCNGMESNQRLQTVRNWTWMDTTQCNSVLASPMLCYFPQSEMLCPDDHTRRLDFDFSSDSQTSLPHPPPLSKPNGNVPSMCSSLLSQNGLDMVNFRQATIEALFLRTSPKVQHEAERQVRNIFGSLGRIPRDLITVHIRWGDKVTTYDGRKRKRRPELRKVEIEEYIDAIRQILNNRRGKLDQGRQERMQNQPSLPGHSSEIQDIDERPVNIYLATEDPTALAEFQQELPHGWNLYVDQYLVETVSHRVDEYNGNAKTAKALQGKSGLYALGSLLVAMEANDFVLTTGSNWSMLMEELRRSVLDPRCGNCTSMIDLRK
jgi:hypothetical protein